MSFEEQIIDMDKYPSIFSCHVDAIAYISAHIKKLILKHERHVNITHKVLWPS